MLPSLLAVRHLRTAPPSRSPFGLLHATPAAVFSNMSLSADFPAASESFAVADPAGLANGTPLLDTTEQGILDEFLRNPDAFGDGHALNRGHHAVSNANFNFLMTEATPELHDVSLFGFDLASPAQNSMNHFAASSASSMNPIDVLSQASALSHGIVVPPQHQIQHSMSMDVPGNMRPATTGSFAPPYSAAVSSSYLPSSQASAPALASNPAKQHLTIKQRRGAEAGPVSNLVYNLQPYDDDDDVFTPSMSATFEDAHVGLPAAAREESSNRQGSSYLHSRHHSESFLMSNPSNVHYQSRSDATDDPSANKRLYRFGSDTAHFAPSGFIRGEGDPSAEDLTRKILDGNFGAIAGGHISPTSTRAPSPSGENRRRKREDFDSDGEPASQRRRFNVPSVRHRASSLSDMSTSHRRRRSSPPVGPAAAAGAAPRRPPRENLTDEQKRSNHILSEQRRRNIIKKGFDYVNNIVPGLREGGYSKSNVLTEATEYLNRLVVGNADLRRALGFQ